MLATLLALSLATTAPAAVPAAPAPPLLVVLTETGQERDGLPVCTRHPDAARYEAVLTHGLSGRLLQVYRWVQTFLAARDGTAIEPAYLLMSGNQGGFPRFGFWLDGERKPHAGYVDLYRTSDLTGRFGAMDQIFPHELAHVIAHQLAGPSPDGPANQVHAIGVRTDRLTAFNEGFAEHFQVLAVDNDDAAPATRALRTDATLRARMPERLAAYSRALEARWSIAPRAVMAFPFWYSQAEQASRYHDVKANLYARQPAIPERVLGDRLRRVPARQRAARIPRRAVQAGGAPARDRRRGRLALLALGDRPGHRAAVPRAGVLRAFRRRAGRGGPDRERAPQDLRGDGGRQEP